jgi:copper chaperone CopZ
VPLAAVLLMKGLSPGAALVLLMAGPATNAATITVILKSMGKRFLTIYLLTIVLGAVFFGLIIDYLLPAKWFVVSQSSVGANMLPDYISIPSALIILALILFNLFRKYVNEKSETMDINVKIEGMTCQHCKANVEKAINSVEGVKNVEVFLNNGEAAIQGSDIDKIKIKEAVEKVGYKCIL